MKHHRPSAVLEMPKGQLLWCIVCSKPWPCPDASGESATEVGRTHDPLCGYDWVDASDCQTCQEYAAVRADEREQAAQRVAATEQHWSVCPQWAAEPCTCGTGRLIHAARGEA